MLKVKLQKWGNSNGIKIPKNILKSLNLKTDNKAHLICDTDKKIIQKQKRAKISLEERFKSYKGDNLSKDFEWDEPIGREIW